MFAASVAASSAYRKRGRVKDESEEEQLQSALACLLVAWTAWGVLSGPQAQELAEAAVEDGLRALPLRRIAKAGNSGAWEQNIKRDVFFWLSLWQTDSCVSNFVACKSCPCR